MATARRLHALRPGADDYALVLAVVGRGSGLAGSGAEDRARAMVDWLIAPTGGRLPRNHVHALIGRDHEIGAASLRHMLYDLIPDLDARLTSGGIAGRRCYLYLTGSGVQIENETRLVARGPSLEPRVLDASFERFVGYLRSRHIFEQVVGIADVLIDPALDASTARDPVFPHIVPTPTDERAPAFTIVSATTREMAPRSSGPTPDTVARLGVTGVILGAFSNARDAAGAITAASVRQWVLPRLRMSLPELEQLPRFEDQGGFVLVEAPEPVRMPNAYALLIGIDDYVTIPRLYGCADDARALATALSRLDGAGYLPANVGVLTDRDATREAVLAAFARLAEKCDAESTVLVWFSGRASVDDDGATRIFLADDELSSDVNGLGAGELDALLDRLRSQRVVVIFDTSGGCAGMAVHVGRILLSATLPAEDAYTGSNGSSGGDFTRAILRALDGGAVSGSDDLSVFDVFEFAHAEVVRYGKQHPTIGMRWGEIGFPIAKRPIAPSVPSAADADGFVYDVHVVHSLQSSRAGFVQSELLPALQSAGLRVAVSAPLETSPVARVVQIERGIRRSRKTLLLDSRGSSGDADFDDVLRLALGSQPPLVGRDQLVVVAIEGGRVPGPYRQIRDAEGKGVFIESEPFDLIDARTARHGSVQRLIERLREPRARASRQERVRGVPQPQLVEVSDESDPPQRWVISPEDSTSVLSSSPSSSEGRALVRVVMQKGDVVFLTDAVEPVRIVAVTRVLRAFRPAAAPSSRARVMSAYDFAPPVRLSSPVLVSTDTVSLSSISMDVAASAVRHGPPAQRDAALSLLAPVLGSAAAIELLGIARSIEDPIDRGSAVRSVAWHAKANVSRDVDLVLDALRNDVDPAVRALAPATGAPTPFLNACFFDATLERNRVVRIGGTLGVQLQRWRGEPLYVHERGLASFEQTVGVMRQSAYIVLVWSSEMADDEWRALMREAVAIDDRRMAHFGGRGIEPPVSTLCTLVLDGPEDLPPELASRPTIDVTALLVASDDIVMTSRVTAQLVHDVLAASQLLIEYPLGAVPRLSQSEALERIEIVTGDLLEADVDAIVNPIGTRATDTGEIGFQLFDRIGNTMVASLERHDSLVAGESRLTLTGGRIPARYVIHACTQDHRRGHTVESVAVGALGALRAAEALPSVRRIALPALGSGAAGIPAVAIASSVLPALVRQLTYGSSIEHIRIVVRDEQTATAYQAALGTLRLPATAKNAASAARWYLSLRQTSLGTPLVGSTVSLGVFFSRDEQPNATPLDIPFSAFELTVYVDSTAAFHLDGSSQQTVVLDDGNIAAPSLPLRLLALTSGTHTIRVTANARGARTAANEAVVTCTVAVEPPILLPDIPELIDRRTIPSPQPDVVLYVATEPTARTERLRVHLTCAALGLDRRRIEPVLPLDADDAAAIRVAAASAAGDLDGSAPRDARDALLAFGGMLYDVLVPPGHEIRSVFARLLALPARSDRPLSWLVVSDEAAVLPWELVCPHGFTSDAAHWYDEPLASRFAVAHWISRRGFEMPNDAPVGPLGLVHYGQHADAHVRWRDAIGADLASEADRHLGLDVLRRGSPYFGVHLLRFTDATEAGRIAEVGATSAQSAPDPLAGERRLDFTLRRPIVSLSLVDATLDRGMPSVRRYTNIEPAWVVPFLLARSSAVVGPRWTTAPSSDRIFYRAFYDAVRADRSLGLAVWEAREALHAAHPDRADWLAYSYFGHPSCEPYPVEDAEGFTLFEPMGLAADEPFIAGRDYVFRASFRGELPAWYNGRRHMRTARLRGEDVHVLVAPLDGGNPMTFELVGVSGTDADSDDDYYRPVVLSMPNEAGTYKWFVQFTRGDRELRSSVITLEVVAADAEREARSAHDLAVKLP